MSLSQPNQVPWKAALIGPALAGALGWGIRGQYGHETGAMIAGLLIALVLVLQFSPQAKALHAVRTVAWCTLAMGIGGSMTYGQTIGLTQDTPLIGNWSALTWGMIGLAMKGGLWIGLAGAFLGMGLSGKRYGAVEVALLLIAMLSASAVGIWVFNDPFDPAHRRLPSIYFSADWRWLPDAELKPRREVWGGLLLAWCTVVAYLRWIRHDLLGCHMAAWGLVGGALGFPLGQSIQAMAAWNREWLQTGWFGTIYPLINWWNFMETIFGAVLGAALGLGLWRNQHRIGLPAASPQPRDISASLSGNRMHRAAELFALAVHVLLLAGVEFAEIDWIDQIYDYGLLLVFIPMVGAAGGIWWPYWVILPLVTMPIAGKTVVELVYNDAVMAPLSGWILYLVLPLAATTLASMTFSRANWRSRPAHVIVRPVLLLATWLFFGLNFAMFHHPWPWTEWTQRTPHALVFAVCAVGLTWLALRSGSNYSPRVNSPTPKAAAP